MSLNDPMRRLIHLTSFLAFVSLSACGPAETAPPPDPPVSEAGFLDVPAQAGAANYPARLFYSYHPAEVAPEEAPLLVFFNGGPGAATSGGLMAFGVGPTTMTAEMAIGDGPVQNPDRWSRFAHLLFLDARQTGFSYGLLAEGGGCVADQDAVSDAGDFIAALLDFMDARPALTKARVVLVGESYGGTRSAVMLHLLQHHADEAPIPGMPDPAALPWLRDRAKAHFDKASPTRAGGSLTPDEVAQQFGFQVLIQPNVGGQFQFDFEQPLRDDDPLFQGTSGGDQSIYDIRVTGAEIGRRLDAAATALLTPSGFAALAGEAPEDVSGLAPGDRGAAFRDQPNIPAPEGAQAPFEAALGALGPGDYYWGDLVNACGYWLGDVKTASAFLGGLVRTRTFVTRAHYDGAVYSPALPSFLDLSGADVALDDAPRPGVARPGWITIAFETGEDVEIRFPPYESGHMVSMTAAHELSQDVEAWLSEVAR